MKSKALWMGLLVVGVADWLVLNVVVGPSYLASSETPAMASPPERAAAAAVLPRLPPATKPTKRADPPPVPEATGTPPVPEATGTPPVPEAATDSPAEAEGSPAVPSGPKSNDATGETGAPSTEPLLFSRQSAELGEDARRSLKQVGRYMLEHPDATVVIEGHADKRGKDEFNAWLSLQRARAVRAYLHGLGVATKQMKIEARGSNRPLDTSGSEDARAKNRRVELILK